MEQLGNLSRNTNGLVAEANFEGVRDGDRLLNFTTSKGVLLEVFYENETMLLRRYHNNGTHFDYILFDPLFRTSSYTPIDAIWTVRYFFTAHFMWIEVQLNQTLLPSTTQYLSLAYFGLDYDFNTGNSNMSEFLSRKESATIHWGSNLNSSRFKIPGKLKIYEFNYTNLSKDIQEKFSYPKQQRAKVALEEDNILLARSNVEESTSSLHHSNQKLTVYPNPSSEYFVININSEDNEKVQLTIFDISGKLLYQLEQYLKKGDNSILLHHKEIGIMSNNSEILLLKVKGRKLDAQEKIIIK
ncbi:MAG: T9SS type A sorting domain-containing protein [Polaribacter sp.]